MFNRVREIVRDEGIGNLPRHIADFIRYSLFRVDRRYIYLRDFAKYQFIQPNKYPIVIKERIPGCYRASIYLDGVEASWGEVTTTKAAQRQVDPFDTPCDYSHKQGYFATAYTRPEYRGRGLQKILITERANILKREGFTSGVTNIVVTNAVPIHNIAKTGGVCIARVMAIMLAGKYVWRQTRWTR